MMATNGTVRARWVPLWGADLADGTHLEHGDEHDVPASEAAASENWQPIKPVKAPDAPKSSKDEE